MVVNRVAGAAADAAPYKILSCPIRDPNNRVTGLVALFRSTDCRGLRASRRPDSGVREPQGGRNPEQPVRSPDRARESPDFRAPRTAAARRPGRRARAALRRHRSAADDQRSIRLQRGRRGDSTRRPKWSAAPQERTASRAGSAATASRCCCPSARSRKRFDVGKKILAAAGQIGYVDGSDSLPVSVSVGVAGAARERMAHLLASAELACKRAKQQGRNRIETEELDGSITLLRSSQLIAAASLQRGAQEQRLSPRGAADRRLADARNRDRRLRAARQDAQPRRRAARARQVSRRGRPLSVLARARSLGDLLGDRHAAHARYRRRRTLLHGQRVGSVDVERQVRGVRARANRAGRVAPWIVLLRDQGSGGDESAGRCRAADPRAVAGGLQARARRLWLRA